MVVLHNLTTLCTDLDPQVKKNLQNFLLSSVQEFLLLLIFHSLLYRSQQLWRATWALMPLM